jgi:hypothetical protein
MIYLFYISGFMCLFGQIISLMEYKEITTTSKFSNIDRFPYKIFAIWFTWVFITACIISQHEILSCFLLGMLLFLKVKSKSNFVIKHLALLFGILGLLIEFKNI